MPTKIIDSRRLMVFKHVAKIGSLSKAEGDLLMAQSAISRNISKLEEDLGVQLLERHGRGVTLTPYGQILLDRGEAILDQMAETFDEIEEAKHRPIGRVRVASSAVVMSLFMPDIVAEMLKKFPEVELIAVQVASGEVYSALTNGKVDIAIVMQIPNKNKYNSRMLLEEEMILITAKDNPIAAHETIKRNDLKDLKLVLPASPSGLRMLINDYMHAGHIDPKPALQADSIPLMKKTVINSDFCTILPRSSFEEDFGREHFAAVKITPYFGRTLFAASAKSEPNSIYIESFLDIASAVFERKGKALRPGS